MIAHSRKGGSDELKKRKGKYQKKPHQIEKRRRIYLKKDLHPLKEDTDLGNFKTRKSFKTRERFNALTVISVVTLLQISGLERKSKRMVQRKLTWCKMIQI